MGQPAARRYARLDPAALTGHEIAFRRLSSLRLGGAPFERWQAVIGWLGAVQSQDYPGGKWSIGQRTPCVLDAELDRALASGELIRTHVLRPTWHFLLPADVRWMLALTGPRIRALNAYYERQAGLNDDSLAATSSVIARALEGRQLTRRELQSTLASAGYSLEGLGLAYVLMYAELEAVMCSGAMRGKQQTYALFDERVPPGPLLSREEALLELTRRYFSSHGPAAVQDFHWWSSLPASDIKRALSDLANELESETIDGTTYWSPPFVLSVPKDESRQRVHLLQGYDEYFVGYSSQTKYVLDLSRSASKHAESAGVFTHVVVLDSQAAGRWRRNVSKGSVTVEVDLFTPFDPEAMNELQRQVEALGRFLALPATLSVASS